MTKSSTAAASKSKLQPVKTKRKIVIGRTGFSSASIRAKVFADIKRIRLLWSNGYSDMEIRRALSLDFRQWKRRVSIMRAVPPDEDLITSYRRYYYEHTKLVAKLQRRLRQLAKTYRQAAQQIEIFSPVKKDKEGNPVLLYTRPRDLALAGNTQVAMAQLDKDILKAEKELIDIKQRLGIVEEVGKVDEDGMIVTMGNLVAAMALRRERELGALNGGENRAAIDVTPAKKSLNGKVQKTK